MNPLLNLQPHEFCIIFPKGNSLNLFATQKKCEQLGVATSIETGKNVFQYDIEKGSSENTVSESDVKAWINAQGETIFFENKKKKDFINWKKLMYSGQDESLALALTLLNTAKRPQPKYFALWLAIGSLHRNESVRETGEMMAFQYLTTEEWKLFHRDNIETNLLKHVRREQRLPDFIDINYLQFWAEIFMEISDDCLFFYDSLILQTKGLDEVWKEPKFKKILKKMSVIKRKNKPDEKRTISLYMEFEQGDDLTYVKKISTIFSQINVLYLYRKDVYQLTRNELKLLNRKFLLADKFLFPKEKISFTLDKVENLEWIYPEAINYSGKYFPNLNYLDLKGTVIEQMDISQNVDKLTELILCLENQKTLPSCIYDCKKLERLHIHDSVITQFDEAIKKLRRVDIVCLTGTRFEKFPVELFLLKKSVFINDINAPMDDLRLSEYKKLGKENRLAFSDFVMDEFPYFLARLPINSLSFERPNFFKIDERILDFPTLESLSIDNGKFEKMPEVLLKLKTLKTLVIRENNISAISFEWFLFVNQQEVIIRLNDNPIHHLPEIPLDFDSTTIEKDRGQIFLNKNLIPSEEIEQYLSIFGKDFFGKSYR